MWVPLRCCANNAEKETSMSRFQKGSHVTWHSQYHLEKEQHDQQQVQLEPRSNDQVTFSEGPLGVPPSGGHKAKPRSTNAVVYKHHDDASVLTNRPMPFGAHARIGQDLRDGVLGSRRLFALVSLAERADVVHRMVVRDELERLGDAVDEVVLPDGSHVA